MLKPGWLDITEDVGPGNLASLAQAEGVGALQFSVARYSGGPLPQIGLSDLEGMLRSFGSARDLGAPADVRCEEGALLVVKGDFNSPSEVIRA